MESRHVVVVSFPVQGHINPSLQFAKRLLDMGIQVTFATGVFALRCIAKTTVATKGLIYASFSDGYDDGFEPGDDPNNYIAEMRSHGSKALKDIIVEAAEQGCPVTCLFYTLLLPWASEVVRELLVPCALLWVQPATVANSNNPSWEIQLPGIPLMLSKRDLPTYILPASSNRHDFALPTFKEQFDSLDSEIKPKVLVNTFDTLEADALKAVGKYELIGIGPLIPSASLGGKGPSDDCGEWLDSKPESSVVYVSFGSILSLEKRQMKEIARGLQDSGRPFIWVIRATDEDSQVSFIEELDQERGKIVAWCSQLEVLKYPSLGCFVTHCGWNSTLESISCGVTVVAFPHWTDQGTNAKLIEDVWRNGVRVRVRANEDGIVERGEIRRCIDEVMDGGKKSIELRESAAKWKGLASEAMGENGSSESNLKAFLEDLKK